MFSKFVSSVSSNIHKTYDVQPNAKFYSGPWAVYDAHRRASSTPRPAHQNQVSVFVFEKKSLEQSTSLRGSAGSTRAKNDTVFARLKKEVSLLSRLRHPCLLEVVEPIEDTRGALTFVTERVISNLQALVGGVDDPDGFSDSARSSGRRSELDELEIQSGLASLTKALQFLHESAMIVHTNLTPQAIYINAKGDWKIGGFGFGVSMKNEPGVDNGYEFPEYDSRLPRTVQRNLDFLAPEYVTDEKVESANDMFSLGCIIVAIHNKGRSLINSNQSIHTYRQQITKIDSLITSARIPSYLQDTLRQLLTKSPDDRLSASAFQHSPLFDNILMNSIRFLDSFPEKTVAEKSSFLRGFVSILPQFSDRIRHRKILPSLLAHVQDTDLLPLLLPNIFAITKSMSQLSFSEKVLPTIKNIIQSKELPDNVSVTLLDSVQHLKEKTTAKEFADDVMPLIYNALGAGTFLQEKALKISGELAEHLDFNTVKSALFPKVANVFTHTTTLGTKIATLECFLLLVPKLDNFTMSDKLIPLLKNIKTKEPSVTLAALAVYAEMGKRLGHEVIASDILPALWPMTVGVLLNLEQFNRLLGVIRELEAKVVQQQTQKLQDVAHTAGVSIGSSLPLQDKSNPGPMEETTLDFENLVLGKKAPMSNHLQSSARPITAFQTSQPQQGFTSSMPSTPISLMSPMNPTALSMSQTTPPPAQNSFFPPLQPTSMYAASSGPNPSSFQGANFAPPRSTMATSNIAYNPTSGGAGGFGTNSWNVRPTSSDSSLPTIAPPPNKTTQFPAGFTSQPKPSNNGLDKYQSLL